MYFKNILGQDRAKKFILNSLSKDRISHAYLFEGLKGVGKKDFAFAFSKILIGDALENSPDFKVLKPEGASFKIEQIRNLQSDIIVRPYGNKKVYILEDAHKMTIQAQNSLLKTLEEPPSYCLLILLTENSSSLLDTIKSRCEIVKFTPLSQQEIENYLVEDKKIGEEKARVVASFSGGILFRALELIESESFNAKREDVKMFIELVLTKNIIDLLKIQDALEKQKEEIESILDMILTYLRDIMVIKENIQEKWIIHLDEISFLKECSKKLTYSQVSNIIDIIEETKKKLRSNCNFSLAMEVMLLNIQEVIK